METSLLSSIRIRRKLFTMKKVTRTFLLLFFRKKVAMLRPASAHSHPAAQQRTSFRKKLVSLAIAPFSGAQASHEVTYTFSITFGLLAIYFFIILFLFDKKTRDESCHCKK
jgi:hypothetical protein